MGATIDDLYRFVKLQILPKSGGFHNQDALFVLTVNAYLDEQNKNETKKR